jgi:hypothetical protein
MRVARAWATLLVLAQVGACGDDQGAPVTVDASTSRICTPQDVSGWKPTWRPPELPRAACTNAQLAGVISACESVTSTNAQCSAWNRDPANAACLQCLYSTEDEPTYGPVIYLKNRYTAVNIPGCIALLDADRSPSGCGAELQAFYSCADAACMANCTTSAELEKCETNAAPTVCFKYRPGTVCGAPSMYAQCLDHDSFEDYYLAFARMFCGTPAADGGGTSPDGGAARAPRGAASTRWGVPEHIVNDAPAGAAIDEALRR